MTDNHKDILRFRQLFWDFYYGEISLAEMQATVAEIVNRQGSLEFEG